jgi:hypothetical protein
MSWWQWAIMVGIWAVIGLSLVHIYRLTEEVDRLRRLGLFEDRDRLNALEAAIQRLEEQMRHYFSPRY